MCLSTALVSSDVLSARMAVLTSCSSSLVVRVRWFINAISQMKCWNTLARAKALWKALHWIRSALCSRIWSVWRNVWQSVGVCIA